MIIQPANRAVAVTPSDTTNLVDAIPGLPNNCQLYVGGAGNIQFVNDDNTVVELKAVPVGAVLNIRPKRINSTSTTATSLVLLINQ